MYIAIVVLGCVVVCGSNYHNHFFDEALQANTKDDFETLPLDSTNVRHKREDPNLEQQKNIEALFGPAIDNTKQYEGTTGTNDQHAANPHLTKYINPQAAQMDLFGPENYVPPLNLGYAKLEFTEKPFILTDAEVAENPYLTQYSNAQAVLDDFFGPETPVSSQTLVKPKIKHSGATTTTAENLKSSIISYFGAEMQPPSELIHNAEKNRQTHNQPNIVYPNSSQNTKQSNNNENFEPASASLDNTTEYNTPTEDQLAEIPYLTEYSNPQAARSDMFGLDVTVSPSSENTKKQYKHTDDQYSTEDLEQQKNIEAIFGAVSTTLDNTKKQPNGFNGQRAVKSNLKTNNLNGMVRPLKPIEQSHPAYQLPRASSLISNSAGVDTTTISGNDYRFMGLEMFHRKHRHQKSLLHASHTKTSIHEQRKSHQSAEHTSDRTKNLEQEKELLSIFGTPSPDDLNTQVPSKTDSPLDSKYGETNNTADGYRFASSTVIITKYKSSVLNSSSKVKTNHLVYCLYIIFFIMSLNSF